MALMWRALGEGKKLVFIYDNSTGHGTYPPGALRVTSGVNKNPGGKNAPGSGPVPKMKDGWYVKPGAAQKIIQKMHFASGEFKGTAKILSERGYDTAKLRANCTKQSRAAAGKANTSRCEPGERCCCANVLRCEADFLEQETYLELILGERGHLCRMLPKFHPEFNPIESCWAYLKTYLREHCDYSFPSLCKLISKAVFSIPLAAVRRYYRRAGGFCRGRKPMPGGCGVKSLLRGNANFNAAKLPKTFLELASLSGSIIE